MAAEAKKPKRKKSAQRSPARPQVAKKAAKAAAVGVSSVRATRAASPSGKSDAAKSGAGKAAAKRAPSAARTAPASKRIGPAVAGSRREAGSRDAGKTARKLPASGKAARAKAGSQKKPPSREKELLKKQAEREKEQLKAQREKEATKARREKELEQQRLAREKLAEQARLRKEKEQAKKQAEREKEHVRLEKERQKADEIAQKLREKEHVRLEKERQKADEIAQKLREKDRLVQERAAEKERQLAEKEDEREAQRLAREADVARLKAERDAEREAQRLEKEAERNRQKAEREAEKVRLKVERDAERDRVREEARKKRDEERARRESEREAYRKAKEAEQNRIRTERAAARRALEGRVARNSGRSAGGARASTTTRVYSPASIPDQSGTRRNDGTPALLGVASQPPPSSVERVPASFNSRPRTLPPPPPPPEPPASIEERYARVLERLGQASAEFRNAYEENFVMSWIHHDSALEGVVYTYEELRTAVNPNVTVVPDSSLQSVCEEIRRHKQAIEVVRELGERKRQPATLDQLKRIYLTLHPEEGDLKTVRYRKEIPQHRMYFHEYAAPDKIPYKVRQVFDWLNGPEPKKLRSPLRVAGRVHYDLIRIFPFAKDSGKVARLFMNMLLLRADYPPAILHSTERQRYYEALKGSPNTICNMLESAIANALQSIDKQLGTQDTRLRAIVS